MSRSHRKTLIFNHSTAKSEKADKKMWHQRWRAQERTVLSNLSSDGLKEHLPVDKRQSSNVWLMSKDGRSYWPQSKQVIEAERVANHKGNSSQERISLKQRFLHKWRGK